MIQAFLPDVAKGDKRIVLVDGEVAGAVNRLPGEGEIRSNLAVGGSAAKTELTPEEEEICAVLGPELRAARAAVRRNRRDRRQMVDRNQRHLPHRHRRYRPLQRHRHGGNDLGCDRASGTRAKLTRCRVDDRFHPPPDRERRLFRHRRADGAGEYPSPDPLRSHHGLWRDRRRARAYGIRVAGDRRDDRLRRGQLRLVSGRAADRLSPPEAFRRSLGALADDGLARCRAAERLLRSAWRQDRAGVPHTADVFAR